MANVVCALFAEALMNRTPWALWDLKTGNVAEGADTSEAAEVLETAMARMEAAGVYRADLGLDDTIPRPCQNPDNVWSLHGYHECLTRLGRTEEAALIKQRLDLANGRTDVPVKSSCFCKQGSI